MDVITNTSVIADHQRKYVGMLHEMLTRYSVGFGKTSYFAQLVPSLMRNDAFRVEFSMLVQWIQRQEEGRLTLNRMVELIWSAVTGSRGDGLQNPSSGPLMILLRGLGGWPGTEATRETIVKSAPTPSASEPVTQFGTFASGEHKRELQDTVDEWAAAARRRQLMTALWLLPILPPLMLCVALYRDYVGRRVIYPGPTVRTVEHVVDETVKSEQEGRSGRVGSRRQPGGEKNSERATTGLGETQRAVWRANGVVLVAENGQILKFDETGQFLKFGEPGRIEPLITAPAKIQAPKPEPPFTIMEGGLRMPTVVPEPVVTMSYPTVIVRPEPVAEPDKNGPPSIVGTESRTPAMVMPVVVASATAPPMPTAVRPESSASVKALSSAKPFDLTHPRVSVSAGLLSADIVKFQMPSYPKSARKQRIQGDVLVRLLISEKGKVVRAVALNGPQNFRDSVEKAVTRWRYVPYIENGKPVLVQTWVTFHFELRES